MIVYEYIMTSDSGFAPNPFHGVCTLACCKPKIRKGVANEVFGEIRKILAKNIRLTKKKKEAILKELGLEATDNFEDRIKELFLQGDARLFGGLIECQSKEEFIKNQNIFIIGLAGKQLNEKLGQISGDKNPIIYIMRVTDILSYDQYFNDEKYKKKKPHDFRVTDANNNTDMNWCGDNIYTTKKLEVERAFHHENGRVEENENHDLSGQYILLSSSGNFVYYGQKANGEIDIGSQVRGRAAKKISLNDEVGDKEALREFLYAFDEIEIKGVIAPPINSKIRMEDIN